VISAVLNFILIKHGGIFRDPNAHERFPDRALGKGIELKLLSGARGEGITGGVCSWYRLSGFHFILPGASPLTGSGSFSFDEKEVRSAGLMDSSEADAGSFDDRTALFSGTWTFAAVALPSSLDGTPAVESMF